MLGLIQRVSFAKVTIDGRTAGEIGRGLLVFLGIDKEDGREDAEKLLKKLLAYRVFPDSDGRMNKSVTDIEGGLLLVSQFTLAADTGRGLRPSFSSAKPAAEAEVLYNYLVGMAQSIHPQVARGEFGADMQVALVNDGPVTFLLTSASPSVSR